MAETKKLNFGVFKSMFGDYWLGKIELEPNGTSVFSTFDEALNRAENLNDSIENVDELAEIIEEDVEKVDLEIMAKWLIL